MTAYYNEFDPFAAAWLRELISAGHIAPGDVDTRSIVDVRPDDLRGYTQCHFFAGIGVWSYALRRAGWSDDRPIWTGSCPCQPFSAAGKGGGFDDERHLWPHFHYLIEQCGPPVVAGEQVASKDGLAWLDLVQADMEGTGYAFGAVDTCAAGFGAPHIRQRLYWIGERLEHAESFGRIEWRSEPGRRGAPGGRGIDLLDNAVSARLEGQRSGHSAPFGYGQGSVRPASAAGELGRLADAAEFGRIGRRSDAKGYEPGAVERSTRLRAASTGPSATGPTNGLWRDADWLRCRDGKWRPVEPGTFPLAHGAPARVGRLRGYGNAINAEQAQGFIEAYLEAKAVDVQHFRLTELSDLTTDNTIQEDIFS